MRCELVAFDTAETAGWEGTEGSGGALQSKQPPRRRTRVMGLFSKDIQTMDELVAFARGGERKT
jgi:hypothetical protein